MLRKEVHKKQGININFIYKLIKLMSKNAGDKIY